MTAIPERHEGLKGRLRAWWHGQDLPTESLHDHEPAFADRSSAPKPGEPVAWSVERVEVLQRLFGRGCDRPQGRERVTEMIKPLGVDENMSVLEIGTGLGVGARTIATMTGAWIDAIEPNAIAAQSARVHAEQQGLGDKVTVSTVGMADPTIHRRSRDVVFTMEALHKTPDRTTVLKDVRSVMKPQAHLVVADFFCKSLTDAADLDAWRQLAGPEARLYQVDEISAELTKLGFDIRSVQDDSRVYRACLLRTMQKFVHSITEEPVPDRLRGWVMAEVEYWARTAFALESGDIAYCRINATTPWEDPMQRRDQPSS